LEEENDELSSADVFITPPCDLAESEMDSDDDDEPVSINHLSGRQLGADAQCSLRKVDGSSVRIGIYDNDSTEKNSSESDDDYVPEANSKGKRSGCQQIGKTAKKVKSNRKWKEQDIKIDQEEEAGSQIPKLLEKDWSPVDMFELFYDDFVIDQIVDNSIKYAKTMGHHSFRLSSDKLRLFIALLLASGYVPLPRRRLYWEQKPDVHNEAFSSAMSRNSFEETLRFLHLADNSQLEENDKFAKVRPLLRNLNERWLSFAPPETHLSIDESMIPYYGRHSAKQHIHGKPIRFGYKMWSMATTTGYLLQCEPYQGASTGNTVPDLGLGGSVISDLISELPSSIKYHLYFDNFFTSMKLMDYLKCQGFGATGTIRPNRTERAPLQDVKLFQKRSRGSFQYTQDIDSGTLLVRWHDNNVVTMATNCHSVYPTCQARRWSNTEKKIVSVDQPQTVMAYNKHMGGVDRLDQNVATYRISIRMRKWWWPVFSFLLSATVNNAWQLYRICPSADKEKLDLLSFTRHIVSTYLKRYVLKQKAISKGIAVVDRRVLPEIRYDGKDHIIEAIDKQRRCGQCGKKVKWWCGKCCIPLHIKCFQNYHTK
jgi:DNA excision repair protein ERCC-6